MALAVDGAVAQIAPALVDHFVQAELKQIGADDVEAATVWAGALGEASAQGGGQLSRGLPAVAHACQA